MHNFLPTYLMEDNKLPYNDFDKKDQDSKRMIVIVVISILLGVNGLLLWQFFDKKNHLDEVSLELKTTISEKESLQADRKSTRLNSSHT